MRALLVALSLFFIGPNAVHACGPSTDCKLEDRHYRIRMPDNPDPNKPIGAIVFAHGYQGSAAGIMRNKRLGALAKSLGVALIALKSKAADWKIPGTPSEPGVDARVELDYVGKVLDHAEKNFNIDRQQSVATGFSAGGMMVWTLACHRSDWFMGFAPMAGTFWQPEPVTCDSAAAHVVHVHGDNDRTVPLMGRAIGPSHQGRVPQVLDMYANYGGYKPQDGYETSRLKCDVSENRSGKILQFCLFEGRHSFSTHYVEHAWKEIVKAENRLN